MVEWRTVRRGNFSALESTKLGVDQTRTCSCRHHSHDLAAILGFDKPIFSFDHHLSHAASAYYFSGFDDAAIMTVDGVGEWTTTSFSRGTGVDINIFHRIEFPHSIGLLYSHAGRPC